MAKRKDDPKPRVQETVPEKTLARLIRTDEEYTRWVLENREQYPDPAEFANLDLPDLEALGFTGKSDFDEDDILFARRGRKRRRKRRKGGKRHRPRKRLPNPQNVAQKVGDRLKNVKDVETNKGNVVLGIWNMEFLDASKARYFLDSYRIVAPKQHVLFCTEITLAGLQVIANAIGYKAYASVENNRNQAVGFLVHPRMKVIGKPTSYDEVGSVQGIPNLRPAYRLDLEDTATGQKLAVVVVHLKSMRGGQKSTAPVRRQQCKKLAAALGSNFVGFIGGDWNTHLGTATDTDPLVSAGFKLVGPNNTTPTHIMNSRLDGYFQMSVPNVGRLTIFNFWEDTGRDISDHGLVRTHRRVCKPGVATDPSCPVVGS